MGFYDDRILPHLIQLGMKQEMLRPIRQRLAGAAEGRVIEIGVGAGLNLPLYTSRVTAVMAIDPSPAMLAMAREAAAKATVPVELGTDPPNRSPPRTRAPTRCCRRGRCAAFPM